MSQTTSTIRSFGFFLNGNWSTHGREAVVTSPYDHSVLAVISEAGSDDVEVAIESAVQAFAITRKMTSQQRADVLHKIVEGITARREEFARTICQEAGKPIRTARVEVERAIYTFQVAAEESTRIYGEYIPLDTLNPPPDAGVWCVGFRSDQSSALRRSTFRSTSSRTRSLRQLRPAAPSS